ncbi:MAG: lysylphosphatidylglycerol synthase transmembrane domain-containing protein [Candidatus Saccharibacteria bacterium]|nr:lysylphosphatidylglycerol synthase transmembrane domain-containing protein [Candidatus Saccharibacteria bacterium]
MIRKIISALTLILIVFVLWQAKDQIFMAVDYLQNTNLLVVLMLIPEQLFMYYCCGQMFFSYMRAKGDSKNISKFDLFRISLELNFMNHAVPSGGVSGLGYIAWRLKPYGASYGETSFMYLLRYAITISTNQLQTVLAIIFLISQGELSDSASWILGVVAFVCLAIFLVIVAIVVIASSKKRIDWFAKTGTKFVNWFVEKITFGHKKDILNLKTVQSYFHDIHKNLMEARENKSILIKPILWGVVYSFLEVATYWVVSISMGHPELLPPIMVAEAIGSVIGGIVATPGGIGGYEGSMIGVMTMLNVEIGLATAVVVTTRVIVLVLTVGSGYGFYQHAVSKIGKKERAEIERINEDNPLD